MIIKNLLILVFVFSAQSVLANRFDNTITICQQSGMEIFLKGKDGFFSSREVSMKKNGKLLFEETYDEVMFPFIEKMGDSFVSHEFYNIKMEAYRIRPHSSSPEQDWYFRVSDHAVVHQTSDNTNPKFGGEPAVIIVELNNSNKFVHFDMEKNCKVNGKSYSW